MFSLGGKETDDFASALKASFVRAGLVVELSLGVTALSETGSGSGVTVSVGRNKEVVAEAIGKALRSAKILNDAMAGDRSPNPDALHLNVWPK